MNSIKPLTEEDRSSTEVSQNSIECPECETQCDTSTAKDGEVVCEECYTVLGQVIHRNRAPIYSPEDTQKLRTGGKVDLTRVNNGIGTGQSPAGIWKFDYNPHNSPDESRLQMELSDVEHFGNILNLESYEITTAKKLYRQARSAGLIKGRSCDGFVTVCLLIAIRKSTRPVPLAVDDVLEQTPATREQYWSARSVIQRELHVGIKPLRPGDLLAKVNRKINIPYRVETHAKALLERWEAEGINFTANPETRAGVALILAYEGENVENAPSQRGISDYLGVGESTLSKNKQRLKDLSQ